MFSGSSSWFKSPFFEVGGIGFTKHLSETCGQFSMPMDKTARDRISTHMGAKLWANSWKYFYNCNAHFCNAFTRQKIYLRPLTLYF